jgi:Group II intron, maturase-specific domain
MRSGGSPAATTNRRSTSSLHRLKPVLRCWRAYFRHGVSKHTFNYLRAFTWRRVVRWLRRKHPKGNWCWLRRHYLDGWWPTGAERVLFNPGGVAVSRYRYRSTRLRCRIAWMPFLSRVRWRTMCERRATWA